MYLHHVQWFTHHSGPHISILVSSNSPFARVICRATFALLVDDNLVVHAELALWHSA